MSRRCLLLVLAACSSKSEKPATPPPPADAAVWVVVDGLTEIGSNDPNRVIDPDPDPTKRVPGKAARTRPSRPIDITLKSSPTGARVWVDNVEVGTTPSYWSGDADGKAHEFTFTLPGYGLARYKFVPVQSGTVHARLEPIVVDPDGKDPRTDPKPQNTKAPDPKPELKPEPRPDPKPDPKPPDPPAVITPGSGGSPVGPQP